MALRNTTDEYTLFNAAVATGSSSPIMVKDYQHIVFCLATSGTTTATIKFQGSFSDAKPDFSAAASPTNRRIYVNVRDYLDNSAIAGGTGIAYSGTDAVRMVEMNTNGMKWAGATITAYTQGNITVTESGFSNV